MWPWSAKARPAPDPPDGGETAGVEALSLANSKKLPRTGVVQKLADRIYCFTFGELTATSRIKLAKF